MRQLSLVDDAKTVEAFLAVQAQRLIRLNDINLHALSVAKT